MARLSIARLVGLFALVGLLTVSGCGSGRLIVPVVMQPAALPVPVDAQAMTSHEAAVRGIGAIFVQDLGLPVPERVTVFVYGSRAVFEHGLIHDAHVSSARAAELSDFAIGVGKRRQLFLNDEGTEGHGREWLRLIAHEMAHVSQIELAHGEGRAEQWLAEGMAEWAAFTVLERMGLDTVAKRRVIARRGIQNLAAVAAARLDLETLGSPRGFTVRHLREGSLPTYQLAFLMADYLINRDGLDRVVEYFRTFARSTDRRANFEFAFRQSLEDFEHEIVEHLKSVVH